MTAGTIILCSPRSSGISRTPLRPFYAGTSRLADLPRLPGMTRQHAEQAAAGAVARFRFEPIPAATLDGIRAAGMDEALGN